MALALCRALHFLDETRRFQRLAGVLFVALVISGGLHAVVAVNLNKEAISTGLSGPLWRVPSVAH